MPKTLKMMVAATALCTAGIGLGLSGIAGASVNAPGTPGTPNCVGQTTAWVAQGGLVSLGLDVPGPGIGNVAKELRTTPKVIHQFVVSYCTTGTV